MESVSGPSLEMIDPASDWKIPNLQYSPDASFWRIRVSCHLFSTGTVDDALTDCYPSSIAVCSTPPNGVNVSNLTFAQEILLGSGPVSDVQTWIKLCMHLPGAIRFLPRVSLLKSPISRFGVAAPAHYQHGGFQSTKLVTT